EPGFFELVGVRPLAGRLFSRDHGDLAVAGHAGGPPVVINRIAAQRLGFATPQQAIGRSIVWLRAGPDLVPDTSPIIGVIEGMAVSVRAPIEPVVYSYDPRLFGMAMIRMSGPV